MERLTLQAFIRQQWIDIADIIFPEAEEGNYSITEIHYKQTHAVENLFLDDNLAASINYPVELYFEDDAPPSWLKFLDDIVPAGASQRYWIKHLDISDLPEPMQNFMLLKFGTIAPIGHLRIKEALEDLEGEGSRRLFSVQDVANRDTDFLEYAAERGAIAGGATGAGGEAPKFLLTQSQNNQLWIDSYQNDFSIDNQYYLIKFPRNKREQIDCDVLRAEFHYYHELKALGFNTIDTEQMQLVEGERYPSLWLPRFDIKFDVNGLPIKPAIESVYSIIKSSPGATIYHINTIEKLIRKIEQSHMVRELGFNFDIEEFIVEWVRRDLLNIAFGNSDNHGRNTSFMRLSGEIALAPIYDFAPMKADPEQVIRTTKWEQPLESGGEFNFPAICEALNHYIEPEHLLNELKHTASKLVGLESRLRNRGVPESIICFPSIGLNFLEDKFKKWGLYE